MNFGILRKGDGRVLEFVLGAIFRDCGSGLRWSYYCSAYLRQLNWFYNLLRV
jgi:hypothetical protein